MSFGTGTSTFSKPRRWTPVNERKVQKRLGPGRKTEFWIFVNIILEHFMVRIGQPRVCEIQSDFCDGYHIAKAHVKRRTTIPVNDWWNAFQVCWACQECHNWADWREREDSADIIEPIIADRFTRLGLTDAKVRLLLGECAGQVQADEAAKVIGTDKKARFSEFHVTL